MCGITGLYYLDERPVLHEQLEAMSDKLSHRGPDSSGIFCSGQVGLGHRRLKIIDLSDQANQPMQDREHGLIIVYNGEVYNYIELRKELEKKDRHFKTDSDTEVILHSYLEWELDCLRFFNGMFAFALWDERKQRLFCARDRLGVKPFYYCFDERLFAFASEIKALLTIPTISTRANRSIIYDYLSLALSDHTNETFFHGIHKLPPAHYLLATHEGIQIRRYWDFQVNGSIGDRPSCYDGEAFRELLKDAIQLRLRSDVPIGSCLSGGIDSTSIVCVTNFFVPPEYKKSVGKYQKTYSAVFDTAPLNESPYIQEVTNSTKAEAHWIQPTAEGFIDELDSLLWHQEEPFTHSSIYAQWCVFRRVKETGIKVVLDGQGADEQLCGYRKFSYFFIRELARHGFRWKSFLEGLHLLRNVTYFKGVDFGHSLRYSMVGRRLGKLLPILKPGFSELEGDKGSIGYRGSLAGRIKLDMTRFSLPSLLRYEDKNSMAFSVESRTPYLDFRVIEHLAALPLKAKIYQGWTKYILRMAMKDVIPENIRWRKDKLAFDTPQDHWIRTHWKQAIEDAFQRDGLLCDFVEPKSLLKEFRKFLRGKSIYSNTFFFRTFLLQRWGEYFSPEVR